MRNIQILNKTRPIYLVFNLLRKRQSKLLEETDVRTGDGDSSSGKIIGRGLNIQFRS